VHGVVGTGGKVHLRRRVHVVAMETVKVRHHGPELVKVRVLLVHVKPARWVTGLVRVKRLTSSYCLAIVNLECFFSLREQRNSS
jgi:hypothetical protein